MLCRLNVHPAVAVLSALAVSACAAQVEATNLSATARAGSGAAQAALGKPCESSSNIATNSPQVSENPL